MSLVIDVVDHKFEDTVTTIRGLPIDNQAVIDFIEVAKPARLIGDVKTVNLLNDQSSPIVNMRNLIAGQILAYCERNNTGHTGVETVECWGHIANQGEIVPPHVHPTSFVSAVYYPKASKQSCKLRFDRPGWATMAYQILRFRPKASPLTRQFIDLQLSDGLLVISPSWLPRGVTSSLSPETRVSVVFKFIVSGESAFNGNLLSGVVV